jgi:hypothetical protein
MRVRGSCGRHYQHAESENLEFRSALKTLGTGHCFLDEGFERSADFGPIFFRRTIQLNIKVGSLSHIFIHCYNGVDAMSGSELGCGHALQTGRLLSRGWLGLI